MKRCQGISNKTRAASEGTGIQEKKFDQPAENSEPSGVHNTLNGRARLTLPTETGRNLRTINEKPNKTSSCEVVFRLIGRLKASISVPDKYSTTSHFIFAVRVSFVPLSGELINFDHLLES